MNLFAEVMSFFAAASLALFIGALLTEAMVLVPMWRTLKPQEFFTLHAAHAHRLYAFFAPPTLSATLLAVVAAIASVVTSRSLRDVLHKPRAKLLARASRCGDDVKHEAN